MEDKQLRILALTKLYEYNRTHYSVQNFEKDAVFQGVEPNELNFAFQYLGTQGLILNGVVSSNGLHHFNPQYITGKGIDIVESLMLGITTKIKDKLVKDASSVLEKIPIFLAEAAKNQDLWDALIKIFDGLIEKLQFII